jgi:hypothetical protein
MAIKWPLVLSAAGAIEELQSEDVIEGVFAKGTKMLFLQAAAPQGWTIDASHDDSAIRIVSGTGGGSGGNVGFKTAFASHTPAGTINMASVTIANTTLSQNQMPSHHHAAQSDAFVRTGPGPLTNAGSGCCYGYDFHTQDTGGGNAHNHGFSGTATFTGTAMNFAVKYVDAIICTKD